MHANEILISRMVKFIKPRTHSKLFKKLYKSKTKKTQAKNIYTQHIYISCYTKESCGLIEKQLLIGC